jgi:uncharacterized delta-60 repeat protein
MVRVMPSALPTRATIRVLLLAVLLALTLDSAVLAIPGDLDTSFGGDGKVSTNFTSGFDGASALAIQADGRIVAAGTSGGRKFALARYNTDGTLDTSFGGDGKVTTNFTSGFDGASALAIQADGRLVAAGTAAGRKFALARYNTDGTLDTSFGGGDGKVSTNFTAGNDLANGVAIAPGGAIVAAGSAGVEGADPRFALARYNSDGTLDTSFGGDGKVMTNFTAGTDVALGLVLRPDGRVVAAGTAGRTNHRFALAAYETDGTLDASFGGDGRVTTDFTPGFDGATALTIRPDGTVVAAGSARDGARFALAQYETDGNLDASFGGDGKVTTNFTANFDFALGVALQTDGRVVAAGTAAADFALARYETDGTLDASFGGDGKVTTPFRGFASASDVDIQSDGKIVAAGEAGVDPKFALARYLAT